MKRLILRGREDEAPKTSLGSLRSFRGKREGGCRKETAEPGEGRGGEWRRWGGKGTGKRGGEGWHKEKRGGEKRSREKGKGRGGKGKRRGEEREGDGKREEARGEEGKEVKGSEGEGRGKESSGTS